MILDLHTHHSAPYPCGIVSAAPQGWTPLPGQLYSLGLHPWYLPSDPDALTALLQELERLAEHPQVVAIGESGLDALRGAPMWLQLTAFKRQAELAERVGKPLIIHDVKCHDAVLGVHKDLRPTVPWVLHGFRGKPQVARMFLTRGVCLSFGERFNEESLRLTPPDMLFAETDESPLTIDEIIEQISRARGEDMLPVVASNILRII